MPDHSIEQQIKARIAECVSKGLDKALYNLYWSVRYYPGWAAEEAAQVCPAIENPRVLKKDHIAFEHKGRSFSICFEASDTSWDDEDDGMRFGHLTLFVPQDKKVLRLGLVAHPDCPFDISEISSYVPGDWDQTLLEINDVVSKFTRASELRLAEESKRVELETKKEDFGIS